MTVRRRRANPSSIPRASPFDRHETQPLVRRSSGEPLVPKRLNGLMFSSYQISQEPSVFLDDHAAQDPGHRICAITQWDAWLETIDRKSVPHTPHRVRIHGSLGPDQVLWRRQTGPERRQLEAQEKVADDDETRAIRVGCTSRWFSTIERARTPSTSSKL